MKTIETAPLKVKEEILGSVNAEEINKQEDFNKASNYWESRLNDEVRIETPLNPQCEFCFVVPVYNETPERILRQIESLRNQEINPETFEVIYVVNNGKPNDSEKFREVISNNKTIIDLIHGLPDKNIFVIDKSSGGNEIEDCNVGKARNRGVAEASKRFYENNKNGTLIQTDADTYFEDEHYLEKLKNVISDDAVVGVAGGLVFEFDPDERNPEDVEILRKKFEKFLLTKRWGYFVKAILDPQSLDTADCVFSGANMISKSYESAVIGGLIDANSGEDPKFGLDLKGYADTNNKKVISRREELMVVTALRDSDRTEASFKKTFDKIDIDKPIIVKNPFAIKYDVFKEKFFESLIKSIISTDDLKEMLLDFDGNQIVPDEAFTELVALAQKYKGEDKEVYYGPWANKYFGQDHNALREIYDKKYQDVEITEDRIQILINKLMKQPGGQDIIERINDYVGSIRLAPQKI